MTPSRLVGVLMTGMGRDGADAMTELQTRRQNPRRGGIHRGCMGDAGRTREKRRGGDWRAVEEIANAIVESVDADAVH